MCITAITAPGHHLNARGYSPNVGILRTARARYDDCRDTERTAAAQRTTSYAVPRRAGAATSRRAPRAAVITLTYRMEHRNRARHSTYTHRPLLPTLAFRT